MKKLYLIALIVLMASMGTWTNAAYLHGYPTAGVTAMMNATMKNALMEEPRVYTQEEVELLARLITAEVGTEDEERAYLCGSVVLNRMKSDKFPNTIREVIYQPGQYECTWNGHIDRPYEDIAYEIAEGLMTDGSEIDERVVFQSEFKQGHGTYKKIGNTYFCYQ